MEIAYLGLAKYIPAHTFEYNISGTPHSASIPAGWWDDPVGYLSGAIYAAAAASWTIRFDRPGKVMVESIEGDRSGTVSVSGAGATTAAAYVGWTGTSASLGAWGAVIPDCAVVYWRRKPGLLGKITSSRTTTRKGLVGGGKPVGLTADSLSVYPSTDDASYLSNWYAFCQGLSASHRPMTVRSEVDLALHGTQWYLGDMGEISVDSLSSDGAMTQCDLLVWGVPL